MTTKAQRYYPRGLVRWPVLYWNEGLFGQGTVLEISDQRCRVAGTASVAAAMALKLYISPPDKEEPLSVQEARVFWIKDHEFWLELRRLPAIDRFDLMCFLDYAERHQSLHSVVEPFKTE